MTKTTILRSALISASSLSLAVAAQAQEAPQGTDTEASEGLGDIIVTATKRNENNDGQGKLIIPFNSTEDLDNILDALDI